MTETEERLFLSSKLQEYGAAIIPGDGDDFFFVKYTEEEYLEMFWHAKRLESLLELIYDTVYDIPRSLQDLDSNTSK